MTLDQGLAFAIIVGMMALFVWGRLRYDLVAVLALLAGVAAGIVPPDKAFTGFSDDIVIIVGSALVVSAAVARSGVIERRCVRIAPYLHHRHARRSSLLVGVGHGAVGLREEYRRAGDADAGRLPARAAHRHARRRAC